MERLDRAEEKNNLEARTSQDLILKTKAMKKKRNINKVSYSSVNTCSPNRAGAVRERFRFNTDRLAVV